RGAGRNLSMTDQSGNVTTTQEAPRAMPVDVALGDRSRVMASERYYVHVIATLGTLAEREVDDVGDAVFGRPSENGSLASFSRLVFRTVLQISDYLQSVTAETKSRKLAGAEIIRPLAPPADRRGSRARRARGSPPRRSTRGARPRRRTLRCRSQRSRRGARTSAA